MAKTAVINGSNGDGDTLQKAPNSTDELLEEIDPVTVEVSLLAFGEFLPGSNFIGDVHMDPEASDILDLPTMCTVLNNIANLSDCGRQFKVVTTRPETGNSAANTTTDLALYPTDAAAQEAYRHGVADENPDVARCAWAWMLCPLKVDPVDEEAGYGFDNPVSQGPGKTCKAPLLRETPKSREARAQLFRACTEIMLRQHRTHVFAIYISSWNARFFRLDRAGCVVSRPIDMKHDFAYFQNYIFRLVNLSLTKIGFDDTVKLADAAALHTLRAHRSKAPRELRQYYDDYLTLDTIHWPIYKVTCPMVDITSPPDIHPPEGDSSRAKLGTRTYLIGRHIAGHNSLTGRATRGYIAFEVQTRRMVFLKDSWRAVSRNYSELSAYQRLHSAGVESIATPIAGCDVEHHRTVNHRSMQDLHAAARPVERIHTRLVTKEIGRPLETYEGSFELISFVFHAYLGHQDAWEKAGVLHHDVSAANILIDIDSRYGFMNDWDLAKYREDLESGTETSEPGVLSGTWPYKSALALRYPTKAAELADDIESFVYIILCFAMRFHAHSLSTAPAQNSSGGGLRGAGPINQELLALYYNFFLAGECRTNGRARAGLYKELYIKAGIPPVELDGDNGRTMPLARFLEKAYQLLRRHYKCIDISALERSLIKPTGSHIAELAELDRVDDEKGGPSLRSKWGMLRRCPVIENHTSSSSSSPSSEASVMDARLLDTHDALLELFDSAFVNEDGTEMNIAKWRVDKVPDQFFGTIPLTPPSEEPTVTQENIVANIDTHAVRRFSRVAQKSTEVPRTGKRKRIADDDDVLQPQTAAMNRKAPRRTQGQRTKAKASAAQEAPVSNKNYPEPGARRSSRLAAKAGKKT